MKKIIFIPFLALLLLAFSSFDVKVSTLPESHIVTDQLTEDFIATQESGTMNQGCAVMSFIAEDCETVAARAGVHAWLNSQIAGEDSDVSYLRYLFAYGRAKLQCQTAIAP